MKRYYTLTIRTAQGNLSEVCYGMQDAVIKYALERSGKLLANYTLSFSSRPDRSDQFVSVELDDTNALTTHVITGEETATTYELIEPEPEGFNAMGHPVPQHRRENAFKFMDGIGLNKGDSARLVDRAAMALESDNPDLAMKYCRDLLDVTGSYMAISKLLAG